MFQRIRHYHGLALVSVLKPLVKIVRGIRKSLVRTQFKELLNRRDEYELVMKQHILVDLLKDECPDLPDWVEGIHDRFLADLLKDEYPNLPDWVERIHDRSDVIEQMTDWLERADRALSSYELTQSFEEGE